MMAGGRVSVRLLAFSSVLAVLGELSDVRLGNCNFNSPYRNVHRSMAGIW